MRATGIVRRIDDLGRVVIPKELRRTMRIREGAPLEIFTNDDGDVIFRRYSAMDDFSEQAQRCAAALGRVAKLSVVVCDRERVLACGGKLRREVLRKEISADLERLLGERFDGLCKKTVPLLAESEERAAIICPVIAESDTAGAVIAVASDGDRELGETDHRMVSLAAALLGMLIEH